MKRVWIVIVLLFVSLNIEANIIGKIFGFDAKLELFNKKTDNRFSKLEEVNVNMQAGINDNVIKLNNRIGKVETNLSAIAQLSARMTAYDKSENTSMTAGGDIKIYNDPGILQAVLGLMGTITTTLLAIIFFQVRGKQKTVDTLLKTSSLLESKNTWLQNEMASKARYKETLNKRDAELDSLREKGLIK